MSLGSNISTTTTLSDLQTLRETDSSSNANGLGNAIKRPITQPVLINGEQKERIQRLFGNRDHHQLSASAYDTAWVAMVQSPASPRAPSFPACVNWILENQDKDGSWGLQHPNWLVKATLSSTLACILALKRWGTGEQHIHNALGFMERHSSSVMDPSQQTPLGFDIVFPAMIQMSAEQDFNLNLPLRGPDMEALLRRRELELINSTPSCQGRRAYLAYITEGIIGDSPDHWETAIKFKRKNGSLFNSPSATAAAFIHRKDADSLGYLRSLVDNEVIKSDSSSVAVPAIYPHQVEAQLSLIDAVESLGVERHFRHEINMAMGEIYKWWQKGEEEMFLDATTCAMAFRMLRLNGYPVSPDVFERYTEDNFLNATLEGYLKDERAVMELLRASQVICENESILEEQQCWTSRYLLKLREEEEPSQSQYNYVNTKSTPKYLSAAEVRDAINHPFHADPERLSTRRKIEQYKSDNSRILKSCFSCSTYGSEDLLKLAVDDFNLCQSFHQEELKQFTRWFEEHKLDAKNMAKVKMGYSYFTAAATFFEPRLFHARTSWAKHSILTGLVDEFYDDYGTPEEQLNLIHLLERWDVNGPQVEFCSEQVETFYWALHSAICETVENAFAWQGRSVMDHVVETWVDLLRTMLQESEWCRTKRVPAIDEYMRNGSVSFGLEPIILPTLYMLGPLLSDEVAKGPELHRLREVLNLCGRLMNDCMGYKREAEEGKQNAVPLLMRQRNIGTAEEVIGEIGVVIEKKTRELLSLVLDEKNTSAVPKECREAFWSMNQVLHLVYQKRDGYNSTNLVQVGESVIKEPIFLRNIGGSP